MRGTWRRTRRAAVVLAAVVAGLGPAAVARPAQATLAQGAQTPQQASPRPPAGLPPLPATQIDERLPGAKSRQRFSLTFSQPQPIRDVLLLILKDTGVSVVIDPDVAGTFTGELANVTLQQALEITLAPLALQYTLTDRVLRVSKRATETRFFDVDHVGTRRTSERTVALPGAPSAGGHGGVTSSDTADFHEELTRAVAAMLSADGSSTLDRKAGLLRVTDYPDRVDRVSHYLELASVRVARQVQIEATFIQIDLRNPAAPGVDWQTVLQAAGEAAAPVRRAAGEGGVFSLGLTIRSLDGLLKALATQGAVSVVANPRVAVMNNEPAIVRAEARAGAAPAGEPSSGAVVLTVTPQISADGIVQMSVSPGIGDRLGIRGADTLVRARTGETVVIDGLTQPPARLLVILLTATIV